MTSSIKDRYIARGDDNQCKLIDQLKQAFECVKKCITFREIVLPSLKAKKLIHVYKELARDLDMLMHIKEEDPIVFVQITFSSTCFAKGLFVYCDSL